MRVFRNAQEALDEIERELYEMGTMYGSDTFQDKFVSGDWQYYTKELAGYSYCLTKWADLDDAVANFPGMSALEVMYCKQELVDRLGIGARNPGNAYKIRPHIWEEFLQADGKFSYTYNERMHGINTPPNEDQLYRVIQELRNKPNTRQAVVSIYDYKLDLPNWGGKKRIPCSMYYQFLLRKDELNLIYTMRSCDYYTHLPIDLWLAIRLLEYVAKRINKNTGRFIHFVGSLHAFQKDFEKRRIF